MSALWTRADLERATGGRFAGADDVAVTGVSIDTRTVQPGDLFIALVGDNSDGHAHVAAAFERGAACVMVHDARATQDPRALVVPDTLAALGALGVFARARFGGRVVAITGSVGKTTTKEMLRTALGAYGPTHFSVASYNNHWGVPLTLARMPPEAPFCVAEVGMNHPGEIAPLAAMIRPDVAVITTIAAQHIGNMGSLDAIAREKASLLAALRGGVAVVPMDAPGQDRLDEAARQGDARILRVGSGDAADIRLDDVHLRPDGSAFRVTVEGRDNAVTLAAPGAHLARNAALAIGALVALDLAPAPGITALATFRPGDGRGALRPVLAGAAQLLDESYNASRISTIAALEVLGLLPSARRVAVLGDIRELGTFAEAEHLALLPAVTANVDLLFCCCPHMKGLFDAAPEAIRGAWAPDAASLAPHVVTALRPDDVVLVKGSLGSRMRDVVSALTTGR
ncbi:UDP-N-acetylmuramoyl-tripeptide--D-alanyl-D-alanine ligase [Ameyamaea chiangmaiensis NBRC 103196]|uniref:UDP-N-acetylmuramoyl-tripeptide--D-alanyl-D-alanine ligase n=1 Tax=Ameyamaea chiangmaiensis TaxID=442969 RepID=A0A850PJ82_9PROT|nr:UDP-N-acetylmuramoyl-tripeptide--D-alanyl-D-alanine ligase [Ameyamaea chiangmaiensis]MBS4074379.1 UDP-N-acetylmuramoyl-tripeptide--D-alanyl-D-alanine ligase [Ameyamaea chiangmaiensis]NVN41862.1 UDP-N-acetylmuramoyl-tripeptide--D-alanyl-D-alanine ligase [Ameyamaea chiangmaiensis]GBQ71843.1 UDP-N-acetylmuramoyl-tripeptide--D-alanyl-D-alanine ligase [Ameyamaea chiangmaiensis NBRC 103196]